MNETDGSILPSDTRTKIPVVTIIASILVFFVFAGLVALTYYYGSRLDSKSPEVNGEDQLRELRAQEQSILTSYRYDEATKSWQIPITDAMDALVREGETKGKWNPFPRTVGPAKK